MFNNLLNRIFRAIKIDVELYEEVERDKSATIQAGLVVVLSSMAAGVGALQLGASNFLLAPILSLLSWWVWAYVIYFVGVKLFGGPSTKSNHGELLRTIGFSSAPGLIRVFGVTPDLTTLGKVIGGGLPVGAYGGKKEIMSMVAPSGPVYQAGTLSGNPLAMTAGIKTLELLKQEGTYEKLDAITSRLIEGIVQSAENNGIAINGGNVSAMFGFFLCDGPVRNFDEAKTNDAELFGRLHKEMLRRGIYLAPSPFEAGFTSLAHSEEEIDKTIEAFNASFNAIKS